MVRGAFARATHGGLLAGVLASNSELPAFTPTLELREPSYAVGGTHFLVYLKGEELRFTSHLTWIISCQGSFLASHPLVYATSFG